MTRILANQKEPNTEISPTNDVTAEERGTDKEQPRVVLRFAADKELLLSGMITGGNEIAEKPAVVDVPHGKGHVVLFANNPMWRAETMGSFFLVFNAMLNYDHLNAGFAAPAAKTVTASGDGESQD